MKKIISLAGILLINLLVLELALRLIGWSLNFSQTSAADHADILVLGESTSASYYRPGSWPTQLQTKLDESGGGQKIANEAASGITTTFLVNELENHVQRYHPKIIISMMGINDRPGNWFFDAGVTRQPGFFADLRIVKLFKLIRAKLFSGENRQLPENMDVPEELVANVRERKFSESRIMLKQQLKDQDEKYQIRFVRSLLEKRVPEINDDRVFTEMVIQLDLFKIARDYAYKNNRLALLLLRAAVDSRGGRDYCGPIAEGYVHNPGYPPTDLVKYYLTSCLRPEDPELQDFLQMYSPHIDFVELARVPTEQNYRSVYDFADRNGICWIVVQYPLLDVEMRKSYFSEVQLQNPRLKFVSNQQNFTAALKEHSYDELFIDKFGGVFGHATELGNKLIAESVFPVVSDLLKSGKCVGF